MNKLIHRHKVLKPKEVIELYGRGPIMNAVADIKALQALPPEEYRAALRQFMAEKIATGEWGND